MQSSTPEEWRDARWAMLVVALLTLALLAIVYCAKAYGHDPTGHNAYTTWFVAQAQEGTIAKCCGDIDDKGGDAHYVEVKQEDGRYFVRIGKDWVLYPLPVNPYHENPTGRNVVWYNATDGGYVFYCLRLATGT